MIKIILSTILVAGIVLSIPVRASIFNSCDDGSSEAKPEWVNEGYSEKGFYVGVGASDKKNKSERESEAENLARQHLVESIRVTVKSENDQRISEVNQQIHKDATSRITATADEDLRGSKIKRRWVDNDNCKLYLLVVIGVDSVEKSHQEKLMKLNMEKFKELMSEGTNQDKTPDIGERHQNLEKAQALLQEIDFKVLAELPGINKKEFYEKQLKEASDKINREILLTKDRMALFALNIDHNLSEGVIGKMLDHLRTADHLTDRMMDGCEDEQQCIKAAKNRGFTKLTMLLSNCQVIVSQMGSLKGTLKVTKKVYDLDSRKLLEAPRTSSAEVIGWSNEELDWSSAGEKVMRELQ